MSPFALPIALHHFHHRRYVERSGALLFLIYGLSVILWDIFPQSTVVTIATYIFLVFFSLFFLWSCKPYWDYCVLNRLVNSKIGQKHLYSWAEGLATQPTQVGSLPLNIKEYGKISRPTFMRNQTSIVHLRFIPVDETGALFSDGVAHAYTTGEDGFPIPKPVLTVTQKLATLSAQELPFLMRMAMKTLASHSKDTPVHVRFAVPVFPESAHSKLPYLEHLNAFFGR